MPYHLNLVKFTSKFRALSNSFRNSSYLIIIESIKPYGALHLRETIYKTCTRKINLNSKDHHIATFTCVSNNMI